MCRYSRLIKNIAPDVLHTHSFQPLVWSSLLGGGRSGHVTTVHSNYPYFTERTTKGYIKRTIEKFFLTRGGIRTVAVGKDVRTLLAQLGVPSKNLFLIENGVDVTGHQLSVEARAEVRDELGLESDQFAFITLGRLDIATKGYDILLQAFRRIGQQHQKAILIFIGDGSDRARLQDMANEFGITKQVKFVGFKKNPAAYLSAGDAYVCSSVVEGFGLAVAEAMLAGLPVIATRVGAVPEMISHGVSGVLVEPNDPEAVTAAMEGFLQRRYSLEEMARRGRQRITERYDIRKTAPAYVDLYKSIAQRTALNS